MTEETEAGQAADAQNAADLALIRDLARQAGAIGLRYFGKDPQVWLKEGNSPVSEADYAIDSFLQEKLLAARPDYGWISEETADKRAARAYRRFFVVDPIDGTRGFLEGNPQWCVSIAVAESGRPVAGALECPALGEHYAAQAGGAAILPEAEAASQNGGGGLRIACRKAELEHLPPRLAEAVEQARHIPSLAYRLALLARGALDAVLVRPGCHDWDIAAADVILQSCGGALADKNGKALVYCEQPFRHGFLLAAKQANLAELLSELR